MNKRTTLGLLISCCTLAACSTKKEEKTENTVRVQTETVSMTNTNDINNTYVGEVEAQTSTAVSFTGSGTIQKMLVNEGQHVSRGQLIALMDETVCRNSLQSAQASMKQAQDAYDRMQTLYNRQAISEMDWVQVQANLERTKSDLQNKQKSLNDCRLTAPCSGVVGSKNMESGMNVMSGQTVCNILDISRVKVKISVPEKEISNIAFSLPTGEGRGGASITVDALGGTQFTSNGMERGVTADPVSRTYEVRYIVDNKDGKLLPGMVCTVIPHPSSLNPQPSTNITVPITSVQKNAEGKMFVWTITHGLAHRTPVTIGKAQGNRITILSGLNAGDSVVTKGYQKLNENAKVSF